ncbi:hypothetical protein SAMN05443633_101274 [Chryseobacterium arachidis]|uniref:Uncharacterized protein n=1 Tax=Chryseobacterium arachidis TaxID=1416778 RepID=A0A1M4TMB4_9FLAO|nr:hypothetical protein [Chryseobacterium arachidis]SHE45629.1 hypothetical protein SAMN05443633_101274 [Chryseobacterium arachidis]
MKIDKETISYIISYFGNLMTNNEKLALQHQMYMSKSADNKTLRKIMTERGWINNDPETLNLLKQGYEEFEMNVVKRIMSETPEKVFFNNCPKCGKLARTPYAKQCRYCSHSWHTE